VLWRRYYAQAETFGEAEKGEKANEDDRIGQHPPERLSGRLEVGLGLNEGFEGARIRGLK